MEKEKKINQAVCELALIHKMLHINVNHCEEKFENCVSYIYNFQKKITKHNLYLYYYLRGFSCLDFSFFSSKMFLHLYV